MNSGHKGLIIEIAERLKKNISTLGCEDPSTYTVSTILDKNW